MHEKRRSGVVLLVCLAAATLLAAFVGVRELGSPSESPSGESSAVPETTPSPASPSGDEATPLRWVPGAASALPRHDDSVSTRLGIVSPGLPAGIPSDLGPPPWVRPGTRVTFYAAAASVAQSRFAWVEDPNGTWEDPATGKRYRRTDETGEGVATASGDGFAQFDVLAVDGTDVVLALSLYGIDRSTGRFVPGATTGAKAPGAEIAGTWVHPARLAELQEVRAEGLLVLRGDYPLNGTTYEAISFAFTTPGAYQQYTYDTKSGVLLSATTDTAGSTSPVSGPDGPPQGNRQLTVTFFAGVRHRTMPGADGVSPDWVARTGRLAYTGNYRWANPVDPTTGTFASSMTMNVSLRPGGRSWAGYAAQTSIQGIGSTSGAGVTGPTGLYWLGQQALAALAGLPSGRLVDKDRITGEELVIDSVGRDPATGRELLTLVSRLPGITTRAGYDTSTGVLASYEAQVPGTGTTIDLHLQSGP